MRVVVVIIQKYICKWLVLKFLSVTTSIQCCWRKMLAIREFQRLKQKDNKVATNPIQDSRANLLEEGGNDTVQPCDTTQARSDLDFRVNFSTVQFYAIEHNSKSKTLSEDSRGIFLCSSKCSGESEFKKDLRYRSEHVV